jgi:hypothetical protein
MSNKTFLKLCVLIVMAIILVSFIAIITLKQAEYNFNPFNMDINQLADEVRKTKVLVDDAFSVSRTAAEDVEQLSRGLTGHESIRDLSYWFLSYHCDFGCYRFDTRRVGFPSEDRPGVMLILTRWEKTPNTPTFETLPVKVEYKVSTLKGSVLRDNARYTDECIFRAYITYKLTRAYDLDSKDFVYMCDILDIEVFTYNRNKVDDLLGGFSSTAQLRRGQLIRQVTELRETLKQHGG